MASSSSLITRGVSSSNEALDPIQEALLNEPCILVDSNDHSLGQASKRQCHLKDSLTQKSPLHRAFSLFIFNKDNELLMQQRSDTKVIFPGLWSNTCCSHPLYFPSEMETQDGIGPKRAAQRKVFQELGIEADQVPIDQMQYLTRIEYSADSNGPWAENEIDYIIFLKCFHPVNLKPNPDEVKAVSYVKQNELGDFLSDVGPDGLTPWFNLMADSLLPKWWNGIDDLSKFINHKDIAKLG
jgi:isopentenyl-diphosphate delta-isomerase